MTQQTFYSTDRRNSSSLAYHAMNRSLSAKGLDNSPESVVMHQASWGTGRTGNQMPKLVLESSNASTSLFFVYFNYCVDACFRK
jgi:hypothetical protein